jgi:ketosteroid isomerase-like protein
MPYPDGARGSHRCASVGALPSDTSTPEAARELCRAYERGSVDAVLAVLDRDVELVPLPLIADRPYRGHEGIRRFFDEAAQEWDTLRFTPRRLGVAGDRAVILGRYRAARDGMLQDGRVSWLLDVAGGRVVRSISYPTWEQALDEIGLTLDETEVLG